MTCSFRRYPRHVVWNHERGHDPLHSPLFGLFYDRVIRHPQTLVALFGAVRHPPTLVALFEAVLHPYTHSRYTLVSLRPFSSLLRRLVAQLVVSRPQLSRLPFSLFADFYVLVFSSSYWLQSHPDHHHSARCLTSFLHY